MIGEKAEGYRRLTYLMLDQESDIRRFQGLFLFGGMDNSMAKCFLGAESRLFTPKEALMHSKDKVAQVGDYNRDFLGRAKKFDHEYATKNGRLEVKSQGTCGDLKELAAIPSLPGVWGKCFAGKIHLGDAGKESLRAVQWEWVNVLYAVGSYASIQQLFQEANNEPLIVFRHSLYIGACKREGKIIVRFRAPNPRQERPAMGQSDKSAFTDTHGGFHPHGKDMSVHPQQLCLPLKNCLDELRLK